RRGRRGGGLQGRRQRGEGAIADRPSEEGGQEGRRRGEDGDEGRQESGGEDGRQETGREVGGQEDDGEESTGQEDDGEGEEVTSGCTTIQAGMVDWTAELPSPAMAVWSQPRRTRRAIANPSPMRCLSRSERGDGWA